jgi:hypothetical protein
MGWKKWSGLTGARRKIAKATGIPTTRGGRQRKVGRMAGCCVPFLFLALVAVAVVVAL